MDAVNAAVQAVNILSTAPFLALDQQRQLTEAKGRTERSFEDAP
jgi:hypothetical protein